MRTFATILAISVFASGCAGGATATAPASTPSPATSAGASPTRYDVATGSDQLVLRIATEGGFIAPSADLTRVPAFALYGDGTLIVPGPVDAIYPGPLLPNLRRTQLTPAEIQKILAAADAAGLLGADTSYANPGVADAGTTVFTTIVAGKTHRVSAYALGVGVHVAGGGGAAPQQLADFAASMDDLATFLGRPLPEDTAYAPAAVNVFAGIAAAADPTASASQVVAWPLTLDPGTAGQPAPADGLRCFSIRGSDLASFLAVAATANSATVWSAASGQYSIVVRPLYPEESGCVNSAG